MSNSNHFIFFLCCFLTLGGAFSQDKFSDNLKLSASYHKVYSLPEYSNFLLIVIRPIHSFDLTLSKQTIGKTSWEQVFKYPEYGLSLFYSTLGNKEIFGNELALTYFFKIYILNRDKLQLYNRIGIGLDYVTKRFDLETNPSNVAVGSHVNIHFNCRFGGTYALSEKLNFNAGLSFDHLSNANTAEPNLGINYLTAFTGFSYYLGNKTEKRRVELPEHEPKSNWYLFGSVGGKHLQSLSTKYFVVNSLSLEYVRETFRILHFGAGVDFFYDSSVPAFLEKDGREFRQRDYFQTGIHISQTLRYNRFSLSLQEGIYVGLENEVVQKVMYNRGIIKYNLTDNFSVRLAMKSHLHILDYPEIGIGIKLK